MYQYFLNIILSLIEYCDIIYAGTSHRNLSDIDTLFFGGLTICINDHIHVQNMN